MTDVALADIRKSRGADAVHGFGVRPVVDGRNLVGGSQVKLLQELFRLL